jgi:transposase
MEAFSGAHHWARKLQTMGHTVKLMAPQFVEPYVKCNKNDAADAEAICEAVSRPSMRFVPLKDAEQQAVLAVHRARQGFVIARTARAESSGGKTNLLGISKRGDVYLRTLLIHRARRVKGIPEQSRSERRHLV